MSAVPIIAQVTQHHLLYHRGFGQVHGLLRSQFCYMQQAGLQLLLQPASSTVVANFGWCASCFL